MLQYTPNSLTRGLRKAELVTLGVWMQYPPEDDLAFGTMYLDQLWRGIIQQADIENYSVLRYPHACPVAPTGEAFLDGRVDGVILHDHNNTCAEYLIKAGMPAVLIDREHGLPGGCGAAYMSQADLVNVALSHLWNLGHRRIAHIAGPVGERAHGAESPHVASAFGWPDHVAVSRLDSYCDWMKTRGQYHPDLIGYAQAWSAPQADEILKRWISLEKPPTAVFCANDDQAIDLMGAAARLSVNVPNDVSVVGVDDSLNARSHAPQITSVRIPMFQVGQGAVRALLRLLNGAPIEECRIEVPGTQISARQSTAPLKVG